MFPFQDLQEKPSFHSCLRLQSVSDTLVEPAAGSLGERTVSQKCSHLFLFSCTLTVTTSRLFRNPDVIHLILKSMAMETDLTQVVLKKLVT